MSRQLLSDIKKRLLHDSINWTVYKKKNETERLLSEIDLILKGEK